MPQRLFMKKTAITEKANNVITYQEAKLEVESIVRQVENNEIPIEQQGEALDRATFLLDFCKTKLQTIEKSLNQKLN